MTDTTAAATEEPMASEVGLSRPAAVASWVLQVVAALVMAQTLFFKFTGAEEAVHIFSTLGVEPWGRYLTGTLELVAVVLLLIPRTASLGGLIGVGLMVGAIAAHLGPLGIEVQDDGGLLFALALVVLASGVGVMAIRCNQLVGMFIAARRCALGEPER